MTYPQYDYNGQPGTPQQPQPQWALQPAYGAQPMYGGQPQYGVPSAYPAGPPNQQEMSDAAAANYLGLVGWIGPLIYRFTKGDKSLFVKDSATAALNFQITMVIYSTGSLLVGCGLTMIIAIAIGAGGGSGAGAGIFMMLSWLLMMVVVVGLSAWSIAACCIGASHSKRGQIYRFPGSFRFVK
ncbi:MAG: DUF4870 domain-containing protein [Stackebrandtia sp.]